MDALMESTFALRRKEIVDLEPPVSAIEDRWPALFSERQVIAVILIFYLHLSFVSISVFYVFICLFFVFHVYFY